MASKAKVRQISAKLLARACAALGAAVKAPAPQLRPIPVRVNDHRRLR